MNHVIAIGSPGSPVRDVQERPEYYLELCISRGQQLKKMKSILRSIAYPKRGTEEEAIDIFAAAELIQKNFTCEDLESDKKETQ